MPTPEPFVPRPFRPAAWLPGPHAQTVAGRYLRPKTGVRYRRERLETPDGDFVDLDFAAVDGVAAPGADAPAVLVVHGLEGGSGSTYVLETHRAAAERGMRSVAMNFRSCSGEPNRTARFYHAGDTADLAFVLDAVRARFGEVPLGAVGFSLGGNMLLKYLGERGAAALVKAAAAVSVPFDLAAGARKLDSNVMGRLYTRHFVGRLRHKFLQKGELIGDACDAEAVRRARSFWEFDDAATARLHGFSGAAEYYETQSSLRFLGGIRRPTLLVHAMDDPFVDEGAVPRDPAALNPWLTAAYTEHGGHVGFIAGPPWRPGFWAEREAVRFVAERL